jgi:hypothetical protein
MNAALINTLLSFIPTAFKLLYKQVRMMDPNAASDNVLIGWSSSMDALWLKIAKPIGWRWPPTGTPQ